MEDYNSITNDSYTDTKNHIFALINKGFLPNITAMRKEVSKINKQIKSFRFAANFATLEEVEQIERTACVLNGRKKAYQYFIKVAMSGKY